MFIGTQYYRPPHPPAADWERDMRRMVESGISVLKIWIYWSQVNPRPDEWVWADLDSIYDMAARHGLRIFAQLMPDGMPYWFKDMHPEALFRDASGAVVPLASGGAMAVGGIPGPDYAHPAAQARGGEFIRRTVERFRDHPAMYAWDIWNELWPFVTSPRAVYHGEATDKRWREWLAEQYGTIDALNHHWMRSYRSFDEVDWPINGTYADLGTRYRFDQERVAEWMQWRVDLVRSVDSKNLVTAHTGGIGPIAALNDPWGGDLTDPWLFTEMLDAWGTSCYWHDFSQWSFMLDSARSSALSARFWLFEMNGGRGNYQHPGRPGPGFYSNYVRSGAEIRSQLLLSLSHGADGAVFWQWRPELFGSESPGWGLTTPNGDLTERTEAVRGVAAMIERHRDVFDALTFEPPQVAILWEPRSYGAERIAGWKPGFGYLGPFELYGWHKALSALGLRVEYLNARRVAEKGVPAGIRLLIHPYPVADRRGLVEQIGAWVEAGGTFVAGPGVGMFDHDLNGSALVPPPEWRALLGVSQREMHYPQTPGVRLLNRGQHLPGYHLVESYALDGGAQAVGIFDAHVVMAERAHGAGRTLAVGTFLGQPFSVDGRDDLIAWVDDLCTQAGVRLPLRVTGEGVFSRWATAGDALICIVHNGGRAATTAWLALQNATSAVRVDDLLNDVPLGTLAPGQPLALALPLGALDSTVLRIVPEVQVSR